RRRHTRWPRDWSSDVCSSDLARLDVGEEGVLLGAVEPVDLVDEEDRAGPRACPRPLRLGDDLADLLHPREHRGEGHEAGARGVEIGRASCRERGGSWGGEMRV